MQNSDIIDHIQLINVHKLHCDSKRNEQKEATQRQRQLGLPNQQDINHLIFIYTEIVLFLWN